MDNLDKQRYDRILKFFSEVATVAALSEDHYMDIMHHVSMFNVKYSGLMCEPSPLFHHLPSASYKNKEVGEATQNNKVLSHLVV